MRKNRMQAEVLIEQQPTEIEQQQAEFEQPLTEIQKFFAAERIDPNRPWPSQLATELRRFECPAYLESHLVKAHLSSPFCPVHWRWLRAWLMFEKVVPPRRDRTDRVTSQVFDCLAFYTRPSDSPFMASLCEAYQLYHAQDFQAAELEARILAGATSQQI